MCVSVGTYASASFSSEHMAGDLVCCILASVTFGVLGTEKRTAACKGPRCCLLLQSVCLQEPVKPSKGISIMFCACSRTLEPHLFIFTVESVRAGQEVLLDYGEVRSGLLSLSAILVLSLVLDIPFYVAQPSPL